MHILPFLESLRTAQYCAFKVEKESIPEKDKIVEGINKMYTIHLKIKDLYKNNLEISQTLTLIS